MSVMLAMRRAPTRTIAIIALLGFAIAELAGFAHFAERAHVRCPAHGDLIEAPTVAIASTTGTAPRSHGLYAGEAARVVDHDHCAFGGMIQVHAAPAAFASPDLTGRAAPDVAPPPRVAVPARGLLYRLAPKTSPPRVALAIA